MENHDYQTVFNLMVQQFLQNNLSSKRSFMVQTLSIFTFSDYDFLGKIKRKRSSYICIPSSFRAREENVAISPDLQLNRQCIQNFLEYICIYNQVKTYFSVGELNNFVTRNLKYCLRLGLHYTRGAKKHLSDTECTTFRS